MRQKCKVAFETINHEGEVIPCETEAHYHEDLPCMLISPQALLQGQYLHQIKTASSMPVTEDHFSIFRNRVEWQANDKIVLSINYDNSFLPRLQLFSQGKSESTLQAFHYSVLHKSNKNLSAFQKVWLKLHHMLGHPSFVLVKQLSVAGYLVLAEIPFVRGITKDPLWIGSTQAPGALSRSK